MRRADSRGELCAVPRCNRPRSMTYYVHPICSRCWQRHCDGLLDLKSVFGIHDAPAESPSEHPAAANEP
jgi:hypothetical protein